MAGGDGSQAIAAAVASERWLALCHACRRGRATTSHWTWASTATMSWARWPRFVDGAERVVDLADVNGRSLRQQRLARDLRRGGAAARLSEREAAHAPGGASSRRRSSRAPEPRRCAGPSPTAAAREGRATVLVSNDPYRRRRARTGRASAPRLDAGAARHPGAGGAGTRDPARFGVPTTAVARRGRRHQLARRSRPARRLRPASTARRRGSRRRSGSGRGPAR